MPSRLITTLPKNALSMPPVSPGGGVICVNSARLSEPRPLLKVVHRIHASQNRPKIVARIASACATRFLTRRAPYSEALMSVALALVELAQHQACDRQYHEGHQEQHEA